MQSNISQRTYDYIIAGTGCAGLSLAMHLHQAGLLEGKKLLMIDQARKSGNDRTWCFWEDAPGLFEPIVYRRWSSAWFRHNDFSKKLSLAPYEYKLIRSADFYRHCLDILQRVPAIEWVTATVESIRDFETHAAVETDNGEYQSSFVFSSLILQQTEVGKKDYYLLQHFKGWVIETDKAWFNADEPTLMDFRTGQENGTSFVYVMPFSENRALVEYTLFSRHLLDPLEYDEGISGYITTNFPGPYRVTEEEFGIIPMTTYQFNRDSPRVIHIGTAGGQTKASTGYTFKFIQKHSAWIVHQLRDGKALHVRREPAKFRFYDRTLLNILHHGTLPGDRIFKQLFARNKASNILQFLDNESSLLTDLKIISSLPTWPFLKAACFG